MVIAKEEFNTCAGSYTLILSTVRPLRIGKQSSQSLKSSKGRLLILRREDIQGQTCPLPNPSPLFVCFKKGGVLLLVI